MRVAGDIVIETTRRCNLECPFCLRGEPMALDFKPEWFQSFIENNQITSISNVTFSGGEPLLKPDIIRECFEILKKKNVEVDNFYLVTNGTKFSPEIAWLLLDMYSYQEYDTDDGFVMVEISTGEYYSLYQKDEVMKLLTSLSFVKRRTPTKYFISEGRAEENGIGERSPIGGFEVGEVYDDTVELDGVLYLNAVGDVIEGCDFSYENQPFYRLGRIEDFQIKNCIDEDVVENI